MMKSDHITNKLERSSLDRLSEADRTIIESHVVDCTACLRAYEAARLSEILVKARTGEMVDPSPFFKTRVMAALRERQFSSEGPVIVRLWKAAGALVSTMAALVMVLAVLTMVTVNGPPESSEGADSQAVYSPEWIILEQPDVEVETIPYDQALAMIYDGEDTNGE